MLRFLKNIITRPVTQQSSHTRNFKRPRLETLEAREVPALLTTIGAIGIGTGSLGSTGFTTDSLANAKAVSLPVMQPESVSANFGAGSDLYYQVSLQQGDFLSANVVAPELGFKSTLEILNSAGNEITEASTSLKTVFTGLLAKEEAVQPSLGFYAPQTGTYYLEMADNVSPSSASQAFNLNLERIELNDSGQSNASLAANGSFHAWLNQSGNTVNIAGPTGYGFSLEGDWNEKVSGSTITYSAKGALQLQTAALEASVGSIAMQVPSGQTFSVTATSSSQPQMGILTGTSGDIGLSLAPIAGIIDSKFGIDVSNESVLNDWTIETGGQVMQNYHNGSGQNLGQMLDGIPYLVYGNKGDLNLNFDGITASANQSSLIMVADPADPFLYVQDGNYAAAGSVNGRIPFDTTVPEQGISHLVTIDGQTIPETYLFNPNNNYGQVYASGSFPLSGVPITVSGGVTVNLDANDDGKLLEGAGTASQLFQGDFKGVENVLTDIDVGVNGSASIGYSVGPVSIHVPIASASLVYDGPQGGFFFIGKEQAAEWQGTVLSDFYAGPGAQIEGYVYTNGTFSVATTASLQFSALTTALTITVSNEGISATGTATTPIATADVSGTIYSNGTFNWTGDTKVKIGGSDNYIDGSASFDFGFNGTVTFFDLSVNASGQLEYKGVKAQGSVTGGLDLIWNQSGHLSYDAAYLDFSGGVYLYDPLDGGWNKLISASADFGLNGNELTLGIDGYGFSIEL
jgi:hypothetical protein